MEMALFLAGTTNLQHIIAVNLRQEVLVLRDRSEADVSL